MKEKWLKSIKRKDFCPTKSSVVCSEHFQANMYRVPLGLKRRPLLKLDAVPTVFPSYPSYLQPVSFHILCFISLFVKLIFIRSISQKSKPERKERRGRDSGHPDQEACCSDSSPPLDPLESSVQAAASGMLQRHTFQLYISKVIAR